MNFDFFSPVKIIFGEGSSKKLADYIALLPSRSYRNALLVTGKNTDRAERIIHTLKVAGISHKLIVQSGEPCIYDIIKGVETARKSGNDFVVAIGGGSAIDAGKAIAALTTNTEDIMTYLEVIGQGLPLIEKPLPMIAIPTTSGTGAEVTCNAVISSPEHQVKVSLRSNLMYPDVALIDPELTLSVSPEITAATGMDALTQLVESFTSRFANPITDALCREGIARVARSFKKAYNEPGNIDARADMSFAALLSGITLANAKLGAVHGIAGPMGGMFNAAHGLLCACLLGPVMSANIATAQNQVHQINQAYNSFNSPESLISLNKYSEIARILTASPQAESYDAISYINELTQHIRIKNIYSISLSNLSELDSSQINLLALKAEKSSSMKGNPVVLSLSQIKQILEEAFSK